LVVVTGIALVLTLQPTPAAAAGLLDFLFGGFRRMIPEPPATRPPPSMPNAPSDSSRQQESVRNGGGGAYSGYCVRLCDGRYFPVQGHRNAPAAEQCHAACPATATKVFSGSGIDHAVASDGARYADLPNAFVYRQRIVPSCSCNGRTDYGLAHVPAAEDPTLRPGDIVATNSGFTVYSGRSGNQQAFTPIDSANVSRSLRAQLADVKIAPRNQGTAVPGASGPGSQTTGQAARPAASTPNDRQLSAKER
jgi:hypothetical protein